MSGPVVLLIVVAIYVLGCVRAWKKISRAEHPQIKPKKRVKATHQPIEAMSHQ